MKKFLELIEQNPELKAKIEELNQKPDAAPADFITVAKEYGFELTEADFAPSKGELFDDELAAVTGGGDCFCPFAGGGSAGYGNPACACVAGGAGEEDHVGSGALRCFCTIAGIGYA